jgi:hypothetical protein
MSDPYEAVLEHYGRLEFADILEIGRTNDDYNYIEPTSALGASFPDAYDSRLINFDLINETGRIPEVMAWEGTGGVFYQTDPSSEQWGSQRIDWGADDAFNDAYQTILERSIERIEAHPDLYELRVQSSWGYEERATWERTISNIVSEEMDAIPGLDQYRTGNPDIPESSLRAQWVNALSTDIEGNTMSITNNCETMALIEGSILQRLDEHFLPSRTAEALREGNLMVESNYFFVIGEVSYNPSNTTPGAHAFVMSSATGNIIEATLDPNVHFSDSYIESADSDWNFERFVRGEIFEGQNQYVYGDSIENYLAARADQSISQTSSQNANFEF